MIIALSLGAGVHFAAAQQTAPEPADARADFATAYSRWQQASDIEEKIALGERLLTLLRDGPPLPADVRREEVEADIRFGTGSAYVSRARGVRADNLEKGIEHLEAALSAWTRESDPQSWAQAHNNLGIANWARIRGDRADNYERAITHFEAALTVFKREADPQGWAQLQNNLAAVYLSRIRGERADNLEAAISHFASALEVFSRETDALRWAMAQSNLGATYWSRVRGDRERNQEDAITHLETALTVLTRAAAPQEWAQAENNLAIAYVNRLHGDRGDNQDAGIAHLEAALEVLTAEAFPQEFARAQNNLGIAYSGRVKGTPTENREKSIAAYTAALTVFTRDAAPLDHLRTARLLTHALISAGEWRRAAPIQASAREAFLVLFGEGLDEAEARSLIADAGPLFAESAYAALQRGEAEEAIEIANEGRARMMSVSLRLQALDLSDAQRQRLETLRSDIRAQQQAMGSADAPQRAEALDKLIAARREVLALMRGAAGTKKDRGAVGAAHALADQGAAVVMPVVTNFGGKLIVLSKAPGQKDIAVIDLPKLTSERLSDLLVGAEPGKPGGWIAAYFVNYLAGDEMDRRWPEWLAGIDTLGSELWTLFGEQLDAQLKQRGAASGRRLVWLPSGWLGVFPLGLAQDPASKRRLADDYEIVYAPNLDAAAGPLDAASDASRTLAVIVNPTGDLPGTEKEGALVASHFPSDARVVLERNAASPDAVLAALKGKSHWHFASHGAFSWTDARSSALIMRGGERLTVGRLLEADGLGHPRLVVLSACETGLSDITHSPDEFIGLPGTFTALGAAGVVGTLWPVSDAATALLMARFYQLHIDEGLEPPTALSRAQAWLRQASAADIDDYARAAQQQGRMQERHVAEIESEISASRSGTSPRAKAAKRVTETGSAADGERQAPPYAHPYYWAGFIYTGR